MLPRPARAATLRGRRPESIERPRPVPAPPDATLPLAAARDVLLVRAHEIDGATPLWTEEDQLWATKLARASAPWPASDAQFLAERARHALERLAPRVPALVSLRGATRWRWGWCAIALAAGALGGLALDRIGATQQIDLLAPPMWALLAWNGVLLVFLGVDALRRSGRGRTHEARGAARRPWRDALQRWLSGVPLAPVRGSVALQRFAVDWAQATAPTNAARAALLLHLAAAALAAGLIGGLYLRGLVLDYRAGWQSTFLGAPQVQRVVDVALAPAARVSGVAVPAVEPLRVRPGEMARGDAAPWLHLYATTLALFVVLPRGLLAALAAVRAQRAGSRLVLPLAEPYFQQRLLGREGRAALAVVWPQGAVPNTQALVALRDTLARSLGPELRLLLGERGEKGELQPPAEATLQIALFDLATTPETETHGEWLNALAARGLPLAVVVDAAAFKRRFVATPARIAEREALWRVFAGERRLNLHIVELGGTA